MPRLVAMLTSLAASMLTRLSRDPDTDDRVDGVASWAGRDPLGELRKRFPDLNARIQGRTVLDFGCGHGDQTLALLEAGAAFVVAVDIVPACRARTLERLTDAGHPDRASVTATIPAAYQGRIDVIISQDAMEHVTDPAGILAAWRRALAPDGCALVTFGPPWYAPYGAHMHFFTPVPWVHLLFPERAVLRVRARYRKDGAQRYEDVEGGLGRMSVRRFHRVIRDAGFTPGRLIYDTVKGLPVGRLPVIRELLTNNIAAELRPTE